jgi:DNA-binding HxlR family transcriptional regulator
MDLVGERWSLLIIRELLLGPRRFGDIRRALQGLSANVLTQRLESLERSGILRRGALPSLATVQVYELTRWGYGIEGAILALGRWAAGSPSHDMSLPLSSTAFMLSLKAAIIPAAGPLAGLEVGFRVGGEPYRAIVDDGLVIRRADTAGAPIVFGGDPNALAATFYGPQKLSQSQTAGRVAVAGDLATAQAFVDLFSVPTFSND